MRRSPDPGIAVSANSTPALALPRGSAARTRRGGVVDRYFYFSMTLLIAAVVIYGFSHTIFHTFGPGSHPRLRVYIHATLFSSWVWLLIVQSTLVRAARVAWHRTLGWLGVAMGALIPPVGVITQLHAGSVEVALPSGLWDMFAFGSTFLAAVILRKRPEFHRRLILAATCALTGAAFGRFPEEMFLSHYGYAGVDLLLLLGAARDFWVDGTVNRVYRYVLPFFVLGQTLVIYTAGQHPDLWRRVADWMMSMGA